MLEVVAAGALATSHVVLILAVLVLAVTVLARGTVLAGHGHGAILRQVIFSTHCGIFIRKIYPVIQKR
jgi:hypothetical protein